MAGIAVTAITLCCALPSGAAAQQDPAKQIEALQKIKRSLSPGERKLDGKLAVKLRQKHARRADRGRHRGAHARGRPRRRGCSRRARRCATWPARGEIRAAVPASALRTVATWGAVERIEPAAQAMTARYGGRDAEQGGARGEIVTALRSRTSEGVRAHAADTARETTKVTGVGTKLCALSDGVDSLAASQAAGELPAVDVLPEHGGRRRRGHGDARDPARHGARRRLGFATAFISDAASRTTSARCAPTAAT